MSPLTDLTGEGKTFQTKAELDPVLDKEYIDRMTRAYAPDRDLTDPIFLRCLETFMVSRPSIFRWERMKSCWTILCGYIKI